MLSLTLLALSMFAALLGLIASAPALTGVAAIAGGLLVVWFVLSKLGVVGPTLGTDGTSPANVRFGRTGEQVVGQSHGKYYEAASRGVLFAASAQAAVAVANTISTTAVLALYNPVGSGKRLAIKKVCLGYGSGTLNGGTIMHCIDKTTTQAAPSSGTALTSVCSDIGNSATSVGVARANGTVASTVVGYRPFLSVNGQTATTIGISQTTEDVDGEIVLEPGTSYQIQCIGAGGSTPVAIPAIVWEEVSIVS